ncbi:hypothetical protein [Palleronia abyssalis]|uniref:Uncharacterized protein n=1 Tax=Palleronia abyssalis TaxID=1501240 RepID=A0A2R8C1I1_9RHOB|nr:hypothetical protein [Palleronia abyssalis]SPJ26268.1 hypothetical protein PAA8504_04125 [Palleronia abyssalis]
MERVAACILALGLPWAAFAGGYIGPSVYDDAQPCGSATVVGVPCASDGQVIVAAPDPSGAGVVYRSVPGGALVEYVNGRVCPYPVRPSDSVFLNGAGYITKHQARVAIGCAYR